MKTVKTSLAFDMLNRAGNHHLQALRRFEETRQLEESFKPTLEDLGSTYQNLQKVLTDQIGPRLDVALANIATDVAIRLLKNSASTADNGSSGAVTSALFPDGLTAVLAAISHRQVEVLDALFARAEARSLFTHPIVGAPLESLREKRNMLAAALTARTGSNLIVAQARAAYQQTKEDFVLAYTKDMGLIRSIYPNRRDMQDFFFMSLSRDLEKEEPEQEVE